MRVGATPTGFIRDPAAEDGDLLESHLTIPVPPGMEAERAGGEEGGRLRDLAEDLVKDGCCSR